MNSYNYSSYCQRPEEVDLSVYQLPGSPIHSPPSRERQFLQELRSLRAGIENSPQLPSYHEVPIALSPSFTMSTPQVSALHRTFSDSNVILSPPWEKTLRSSSGMVNPGWMENPPPPFANFKAPEGYSSLERGSSIGKAPAGRGFFKCASPTPWQSSDNLAREEVIPRAGTQRFVSPSPRLESSRSDWELDRNWNNSSNYFEENQDMQQPTRRSRWDNMQNIQQGPSQSYEQNYPSWTNEHHQQRDTSLSRRPQWEQQIPQERSSRKSDWETRQQRQPQSRSHSLIRNPEWDQNLHSNWELSQQRDPWKHQNSAYNVGISEPEWREDNLQHRQQVQRDLLQEIQQHRQQTARRQTPALNTYRQPSQREVEFDESPMQHHPMNPSLPLNPDTDCKWRSQTTPLDPLFENRTSRRTNWENPQEKHRENDERPWTGGPIYNNVPQTKNWSQNGPRYVQEGHSYPYQDEDLMSRSQEYGRSGFFAQAPVSTPSRAMTEPPNQISMLDNAMQNRSANEHHHALGPELEMDMTVTHFRSGDGKAVASRNHSPQRHSYAGTFSEFSRSNHEHPLYNNYSNPRNQAEARPRSFTVGEPNSIVSSPTVSPPLVMERSIPTSPVQHPTQNIIYRREQNQGPKWELDSLYGLAPAAEQRARRSLARNQDMAQRSTVTTPMYGRGTLNERQPERASVERTTAVVNPMPVEQPTKATVKQAGILLNPNETRKTNKRRVMFVCDREEEDCYYDKENSGSDSETPAHVKAYDSAIESPLSRFNTVSNQIGGDVAEMAKKFSNAMELQRHFLWQAASQGKASNDVLQKLLKPILDAANDITTFKDAGRKSPFFNHLNVISEAISALGWVSVEKTPAPFIKETLDSATFFLNRIRMEYKEKDQKHIDWVVAFQDLMTQLQTFVRQTHTTGLVWNSAPGNTPAGGPKAAAPSAGPSRGAPPPPPPPPAGLFDDLHKASAPAADKAGRDALFSELNKGSDITKSLKKVTSDMQTHKNPNLRTTSTVPSASSTSAGSVTSTTSPPAARAAVQKPPKIELENGKQWTVEYHNGNKNIIIEVTDKKQSVYIYKCDNSVVQVKGKCNSVALDGCKKTAVVVDAVVAQIETINCQSVQIQTMGEMPTLSIQKTDGCQVYLSEASKDCEIVTSKSSEMNVLVPDGRDGEFIELPLPEQFKTVYKGGKLVTTVSDIC